jgi:hypothetical protein
MQKLVIYNLFMPRGLTTVESYNTMTFAVLISVKTQQATVAEENTILRVLTQEERVYSQNSKALIYGFIKPVISTFNLMFSDMIDGNNFILTDALINITVCPLLMMLHCISLRAA